MPIDTEILRNALIVSLSILLLVLFFRRKRQKIMNEDLPAPSHAELISLEVAYHPARLHLVVSLPQTSSIGTAVLVYTEGVWYAQVQAEDVAEIIESHLENGSVVERLALIKINEK